MKKMQKKLIQKSRSGKKKEKTVFILMCIVVAIGAIFGKEAVDSISEWLESINTVKGQVKDMVSVVPGPATLGVAALGVVALRPRRK